MFLVLLRCKVFEAMVKRVQKYFDNIILIFWHDILPPPIYFLLGARMLTVYIPLYYFLLYESQQILLFLQKPNRSFNQEQLSLNIKSYYIGFT